RGWDDSGQHFLVSRGGFILEGRHGSLAALKSRNTHVVGAHTLGQNEFAIGIENEGTYSLVDPPSELWGSLAVLCAYICQQYYLDESVIFGHRDFNGTLCPGDKLYKKLDLLKQAVANLLAPCQVKDWF